MESSCAGGGCVERIVSLVLTLRSDVEALLIKALQVFQVCPIGRQLPPFLLPAKLQLLFPPPLTLRIIWRSACT